MREEENPINYEDARRLRGGLTREDVLRLIQENGGTAISLNLSGKTFQLDVDLSGLDLKGVILEKADLVGANLENTDLEQAYLGGTILNGTNLRNANLFLAHFEDCEVSYAELEGAILYGSTILEARNVEYLEWGNYILGDEISGHFDPGATEVYRQLKTWYTNAGIYDIAGKFFYREQEAKRKSIQKEIHEQLKAYKYKSIPKFLLRTFLLKPRRGWNWLWFWIYRLLCGYGEKPERTVVSALVIIFGLAIAYYFWGSFNTSSFWDTLYYSVVSFTAVGYGNWAPQPTGWAKGVGAAEAFLGVFMMALFLVTFTRKMTR